MRPSTLTVVSTATALVCTAGPAAASATSSAAEKASITKVVSTVERTVSPTAACAGFAPALLKAMFGSKAQCRRAMARNTAAHPHSLSVTAITISGGKAKASVRKNGGTTSGVHGTFHFARAGGTWHVSAINADYYRSLLTREFGSAYTPPAPDAPLAGKAYRACGLRGLLHRGDSGLLGVIHQIQAARNSTFGQVFNACSSKAPGGTAPWHAFMEGQFRARGKDASIPEDVTKCIVTTFHGAISETALINTLMDGPGTPSDEKFNKQLDTIINGCTKGGTTGHIRRPRGIVRPPIH